MNGLNERRGWVHLSTKTKNTKRKVSHAQICNVDGGVAVNFYLENHTAPLTRMKFATLDDAKAHLSTHKIKIKE